MAVVAVRAAHDDVAVAWMELGGKHIRKERKRRIAVTESSGKQRWMIVPAYPHTSYIPEICHIRHFKPVWAICACFPYKLHVECLKSRDKHYFAHHQKGC